MLHTCVQKFDVTRNFEKNLELNRASILSKKKQSSRLLLLVGAGLDWVWQHPCISRSDACGPEFTYQYPESKSGIWWCPPLPHQECLWMSTIRHSRSKYIRIFCFWDEYIRVYWHAFASRLKGLCIERTPCCRETLCMHAYVVWIQPRPCLPEEFRIKMRLCAARSSPPAGAPTEQSGSMPTEGVYEHLKLAFFQNRNLDKMQPHNGLQKNGVALVL